MFRRLLVVVLLLVGSLTIFAQRKVSGRIVNSQTKEILQYVNIGVADKYSGTLSDTSGRYTLTLDDQVTDADSITFSSIGFYTKKICVADHDAGEIRLEPREYVIRDVVVRPTVREVTLGFNQAVGDMSFRFFTADQLRANERCAPEGGVILMPLRDSYVRRLNFKIATNHYESAKLRLTFYNLKDGLPHEVIVHKNIIFEITHKQVGWVRLDLSEYDIMLNAGRDVAVTLTLLESEVDGNSKWLSIYGAGVATQRTLYRHKAFDKWELSDDISLVMSLDVVPQNKNKKEAKQTRRTPRKTK